VSVGEDGTRIGQAVRVVEPAISPLAAVPGGVRVRLRVQPRAARNEVAGLHGEKLKIRLAAPPVDGAANQELVRFLAQVLRVPRRSVEITAGQTSCQKTVVVAGADVGAVARALGLAEQ